MTIFNSLKLKSIKINFNNNNIYIPTMLKTQIGTNTKRINLFLKNFNTRLNAANANKFKYTTYRGAPFWPFSQLFDNNGTALKAKIAEADGNGDNISLTYAPITMHEENAKIPHEDSSGYDLYIRKYIEVFGFEIQVYYSDHNHSFGTNVFRQDMQVFAYTTLYYKEGQIHVHLSNVEVPTAICEPVGTEYMFCRAKPSKSTGIEGAQLIIGIRKKAS